MTFAHYLVVIDLIAVALEAAGATEDFLRWQKTRKKIGNSEPYKNVDGLLDVLRRVFFFLRPAPSRENARRKNKRRSPL